MICPAPTGLDEVGQVVLSVPLESEYIMLPDQNNLSLKIPRPLRTSIYVRRDYRKVIKRLCITEGGMKILEEDGQPPQLPPAAAETQATAVRTLPLLAGIQQLPQPRKEFLGTVLTGPPGCGKSSILLLVLAHLARSQCTVVYRWAIDVAACATGAWSRARTQQVLRLVLAGRVP